MGGANLRHVHFLAKTYAKMKEMDPVEVGRRRRPLDSPMYGVFWRMHMKATPPITNDISANHFTIKSGLL